MAAAARHRIGYQLHVIGAVLRCVYHSWYGRLKMIDGPLPQMLFAALCGTGADGPSGRPSQQSGLMEICNIRLDEALLSSGLKPSTGSQDGDPTSRVRSEHDLPFDIFMAVQFLNFQTRVQVEDIQDPRVARLGRFIRNESRKSASLYVHFASTAGWIILPM